MTDYLQDENEHPFGALPYYRFSREELEIFVAHDLSKSAWRLYVHLCLNCDISKGKSHKKSYKELAKLLRVHRETLMRAFADLSEVGLINFTKGKKDLTPSCELPYLLEGRARIALRAEESREKKRLAAFNSEREQIERQLGRILPESYLGRLRRKHGLE